MAKITLLGRDFDVAPYMLGAMRRGAPFIDRINATAGSLTNIEGMTDVLGDFVGFIAIGLSKCDPALTADALEEQLGLADLPALRDAFTAILSESGMRAGEASAPTVAEPEGASQTDSAPSSSSLLPPE